MAPSKQDGGCCFLQVRDKSLPFLLAMQSGGDWPSQLSHGPCPMAPALISRVGSSSRQAAKRVRSNDEVRKVLLMGGMCSTDMWTD